MSQSKGVTGPNRSPGLPSRDPLLFPGSPTVLHCREGRLNVQLDKDGNHELSALTCMNSGLKIDHYCLLVLKCLEYWDSNAADKNFGTWCCFLSIFVQEWYYLSHKEYFCFYFMCSSIVWVPVNKSLLLCRVVCVYVCLSVCLPVSMCVFMCFFLLCNQPARAVLEN